MEKLNGFRLINGFPLLVTPENQQIHFNDLMDLIKTHQTSLSQLLLRHGGILFRGFPISVNDFSACVEQLQLGQFVNYIGGDSPRDKVEKKIYTSTEAPPSLLIPLHQELSFIRNFPKHIYFYCQIPPKESGETIIADARSIYQSIDEVVKSAFKTKHLIYTSRYFYKSKFMALINRYQRSHKSWIEVFETDNKEEVEAKCREHSFNWEWLKNDWIKIEQIRPATLIHPNTNEEVWFNQAHLYDFNPKLLGWTKYLGAKLFYFNRNRRLHEIAYADNSIIPRSFLYHILDVLKNKTVKFSWHQNDLLVLDNILAMHGRAPFSGNRRILTALTA